MKKNVVYIGLILVAAIVMTYNLSSCTVQRDVAVNKSGVQLWGENCVRCHNAPSSTRYDDNDWAVILTHMRVTAGLTAAEETSIREYLQTSN